MRLTGPRRWAWRRATFAFLATLAALFVFGGVFAAGYARLHDGRVLPGVEGGWIGSACRRGRVAARATRPADWQPDCAHRRARRSHPLLGHRPRLRHAAHAR